MTLACEDANSKLVKVVAVANVNDEDRVSNSFSLGPSYRMGRVYIVDLESVCLSVRHHFEDDHYFCS